MRAAERERLEPAVRAAAHARSASQPKLDATGAGTLNERSGDAERLTESARAGIGGTGATTGAGRTMDWPLWAPAGAAVKRMAADSMKAATRATRRPNMVHKVASQPPAVKVCSDQAVCLPLGSMGS
jgi:hypothetical protein